MGLLGGCICKSLEGAREGSGSIPGQNGFFLIFYRLMVRPDDGDRRQMFIRRGIKDLSFF